MASAISSAGTLERSLLACARLHEGEVLVAPARRWLGLRRPPGEPLARIVDVGAASFELQGTGPAGARELVPLTPMAQRILDTPDAAHRLSIVLSSIDDLGAAPALRRVTLTSTGEAADAAALLARARAYDDVGVTDPGAIERVIATRMRGARSAGVWTGPEEGEVILTPPVSGRVVDSTLLRDLEGVNVSDRYAPAVPPHELLHARQPTGDTALPTWLGMREGTAKIVGDLRSARVAVDLGQPLESLRHADLTNRYDPYVSVITGLARLGARRLDAPGQVALLERQFASNAPEALFDALTGAAAHHMDARVDDVRRAASTGLVERSSGRFVAELDDASITRPDVTPGWIYDEARRRAGIAS